MRTRVNSPDRCVKHDSVFRRTLNLGLAHRRDILLADCFIDSHDRPAGYLAIALRPDKDQHGRYSPPLTSMIAPLMNSARSEARNATSAAMSSGRPIRPEGIRASAA